MRNLGQFRLPGLVPRLPALDVSHAPGNPNVNHD